MLKLEFDNTKALLAHVNARSEVHGEEREPAADLKIEVDCTSDILAEFHPALRSLLYWKDESKDADGTNDLADKGIDAPNLRMPQLLGPLKWDAEMLGATFTIHHGIGGKSDIVLTPVKVNAFSIEPREGGTVALAFRVQCHPEERAFGRLAVLVQQEVEVSLAPVEETSG